MPSERPQNNLPFLLSLLFLGILTRASIIENKPAAIGMEGNSIYASAPAVTARAYGVKILGQDFLILKQRELKRLAPASLTKLLTAALALDYIPSETYIEFSPEAKTTGEKTSSVAAGEKLLRDDTLLLAVASSANDAASALAETVGRAAGGKTYTERLTIFRHMMNERAHAIGMLDSSFQNPTGLDEKDHFSSAEDLARLAEYVWKRYPQIFALSRMKEGKVSSADGGEHLVINTNELLRELPTLLGGKTGFTDNAGGALIFLYPLKNEEVAIIVILKSEDRFGDGRKIIQWLEKNVSHIVE